MDSWNLDRRIWSANRELNKLQLECALVLLDSAALDGQFPQELFLVRAHVRVAQGFHVRALKCCDAVAGSGSPSAIGRIALVRCSARFRCGFVSEAIAEAESLATDRKTEVAAAAIGHLAYMQATAPDRRYRDGRAALDNAESSLAAFDSGSRIYWDRLLVYAAAAAEFGDFGLATKMAQESLAKCPKRYSRKCRRLLRCFYRNKPFRENCSATDRLGRKGSIQFVRALYAGYRRDKRVSTKDGPDDNVGRCLARVTRLKDWLNPEELCTSYLEQENVHQKAGLPLEDCRGFFCGLNVIKYF